MDLSEFSDALATDAPVRVRKIRLGLLLSAGSECGVMRRVDEEKRLLERERTPLAVVRVRRNNRLVANRTIK
jgi:hypothetical protein